MDTDDFRDSGDEQDEDETMEGDEEEGQVGDEEAGQDEETSPSTANPTPSNETTREKTTTTTTTQQQQQQQPDDGATVSGENCQENRASAMRKSSKQSRNNKSRSGTPPNRNRSLNHPQSKHSWRSANAFINFVQDFKKDYPDMIMGRNIFQICGERWKSMTDEQKQPYIAAANTVKKLKQRRVGDTIDQQSKKSVTRVSKRKAETIRKETSQKRTKANKRDAKSNSDTDTATTLHWSMSDADSS